MAVSYNPALYPHPYRPGDHVEVNHPDIGEPVGAMVTAITPSSTHVMIAPDHTTHTALVHHELLTRKEGQ